jgi:septum formation protein
LNRRTAFHLYLASRSPRRRELLDQLGVRYEVLVPDVNESALPGESARAYVLRIARIKAEVAWMRVLEAKKPRRPVLAADTTVVLGRAILGKPGNAKEAEAMLAALAGRTHRVLTAVALAFDNRLDLRLSESRVSFASLTRSEIRRYVATGEPYDKAGGYGIQGQAATFVSRLSGSYSGVMGLPLFETAELLKDFGIQPQ